MTSGRHHRWHMAWINYLCEFYRHTTQENIVSQYYLILKRTAREGAFQRLWRDYAALDDVLMTSITHMLMWRHH